MTERSDAAGAGASERSQPPSTTRSRPPVRERAAGAPAGRSSTRTKAARIDPGGLRSAVRLRQLHTGRHSKEQVDIGRHSGRTATARLIAATAAWGSNEPCTWTAGIMYDADKGRADANDRDHGGGARIGAHLRRSVEGGLPLNKVINGYPVGNGAGCDQRCDAPHPRRRCQVARLRAEGLDHLERRVHDDALSDGEGLLQLREPGGGRVGWGQ